jgi:hypothetical protein
MAEPLIEAVTVVKAAAVIAVMIFAALVGASVPRRTCPVVGVPEAIQVNNWVSIANVSVGLGIPVRVMVPMDGRDGLVNSPPRFTRGSEYAAIRCLSVASVESPTNDA